MQHHYKINKIQLNVNSIKVNNTIIILTSSTIEVIIRWTEGLERTTDCSELLVKVIYAVMYLKASCRTLSNKDFTFRETTEP